MKHTVEQWCSFALKWSSIIITQANSNLVLQNSNVFYIRTVKIWCFWNKTKRIKFCFESINMTHNIAFYIPKNKDLIHTESKAYGYRDVYFRPIKTIPLSKVQVLTWCYIHSWYVLAKSVWHAACSSNTPINNYRYAVLTDVTGPAYDEMRNRVMIFALKIFCYFMSAKLWMTKFVHNTTSRLSVLNTYKSVHTGWHTLS